MSRVSLTRERFIALVVAASERGCARAAPEIRTHDGKCISCWALSKRLEVLREHAAKPAFTDNEEVCRSYLWLNGHQIARCEEEQRLRAEQLPAAEKRLAEARKEDEARRG